MNYATVGPGSGAHLNGERFLMAAGVKAQAIPYKGGPEGVTSVLAGDTEFYFVPLPAARGLIASGKVAALGVSTPKRSPSMPDVPTTVEAGLPELGIRFLGRILGAGQDAEGHRRQAQRRDGQGAGQSGGAGKALQDGRRSDADVHRRVRRFRQKGNRAERRAGEGGRGADHQVDAARHGPPRVCGGRPTSCDPPARRGRRSR